ncbi:repressor LexA [Ignavigranum ruoffiae]|uniref:LexA repressor n=1 Tax=Ignavigranum ruoffiae TaxID=89093 RepID=A0A1H8ZU19_9LACT|nr:transcriptional repressor LexA [Ignavigranum ruoffiae]SEP67959.1 repressor LexA [Ignavigranum ruoffiae]
MTKISQKQLNILKSIHETIECKGYPPTVREIAAEVGLASTSTVHGHLSRLEQNGFISRDPSLTRAIELTEQGFQALGLNQQPASIPLLGRVAAGSPILAVEDATDYYPIPSHLEKFDPDELFMLEINGESMINIGILDGDLITVRKQSQANNGDIVVAMTMEDEATCKRFYKKDGYYVLRPENDFMEDIILNQVSILGKVVALYREF